MTQSPSFGSNIAIFQADWAVQAQTVNIAVSLLKQGFVVDVFIYKPHVYLCDFPLLDRLKIYDFSDPQEASAGSGSVKSPEPFTSGLERRVREHPQLFEVGRRAIQIAHAGTLLRNDIREFIKRTIAGSDESYLLPASLFDATNKALNDKVYRCFIGIEKLGLIWAGVAAQSISVPLIYYSLELYTNFHPHYRGTKLRYVKAAERKYHRIAALTVVQDEDRAKILLDDNLVPESKVCCVSTSLIGEPVKARTNFIQNLHRISLEKKIVLYVGKFGQNRLTLEIVQAAQGLPEGWHALMHGLMPSSQFIDRMRRLDTNGRVTFSFDFLPQQRLYELAASAHVGLVFYPKHTQNEFLTGLASEKMALYLQYGLPVITYDYPSFARIVNGWDCGVCISDVSEIPRAVRTIDDNYQRLRGNAWDCFAANYEFSSQFQKVVDAVENLVVD